MPRILNEIQGGYESNVVESHVLNLPEDSPEDSPNASILNAFKYTKKYIEMELSRQKYKEPPPDKYRIEINTEKSYYHVWFQVKGIDYSVKLSIEEWGKFSKGSSLPLIINDNKRLFVYMYETNFYVSKRELTSEEFMLVHQEEILSKEDAFRQKLEKLKAQAEEEGKEEQKGYPRRSIPKEVQTYVWQRDKGKCVDCGSNEYLEYDHIIPISRGGSNTARNIQLLCQTCNRTKSNNIGG